MGMLVTHAHASTQLPAQCQDVMSQFTGCCLGCRDVSQVINLCADVSTVKSFH